MTLHLWPFCLFLVINFCCTISYKVVYNLTVSLGNNSSKRKLHKTSNSMYVIGFLQMIKYFQLVKDEEFQLSANMVPVPFTAGSVHISCKVQWTCHWSQWTSTKTANCTNLSAEEFGFTWDFGWLGKYFQHLFLFFFSTLVSIDVYSGSNLFWSCVVLRFWRSWSAIPIIESIVQVMTGGVNYSYYSWCALKPENWV